MEEKSCNCGPKPLTTTPKKDWTPAQALPVAALVLIAWGLACARCKQTEQIVRLAVEQSGTEAVIQHIHDYQEMAADGIMSTPAVSVDGVVKASGRIPKLEEVKEWLAESPA